MLMYFRGLVESYRKLPVLQEFFIYLANIQIKKRLLAYPPKNFGVRLSENAIRPSAQSFD